VPASAETTACPGVEHPSELRITTIVLPDKRTGPFGRPVIAGCAVWITSGDNFGGIYRVDLATGEVTNVSPIEVVWDVDTDGANLYAIGRPGVTLGDETGTLFKIDPRTGETLRQFPVPLKARQIRILDGRAWLFGRDLGVVLVDPETGAEVATLEPREQFGPMDVGTDAMWLMANSPDGPGLARIDRATLQTTTVPLPRDFTDVAAVGDRLFVGRASGHVSQIDPTTGAVITSVLVEALPQEPGTSFTGLAVQGTNLWAMPVIQDATRDESTQIVRIDGTTGQIVGGIAFASRGPIDLSATADDLWLFKADRSIVRFELPASN
jgi:outer membrane protein assembly factor BamB